MFSPLSTTCEMPPNAERGTSPAVCRSRLPVALPVGLLTRPGPADLSGLLPWDSVVPFHRSADGLSGLQVSRTRLPELRSTAGPRVWGHNVAMLVLFLHLVPQSSVISWRQEVDIQSHLKPVPGARCVPVSPAVSCLRSALGWPGVSGRRGRLQGPRPGSHRCRDWYACCRIRSSKKPLNT